VDIDGVAGDLAFSLDGTRAILTDESSESVVEYKICDNGTLGFLGETQYKMEVDDCCGLTTMSVDPGGRTVFVDSDEAGYIYAFSILRNGRIERNDLGPDYRITRERRLITRRQYVEEARKQMKKAADAVTTTEPKARARDRDRAESMALTSYRDKIAIPYSITIGPDGAMYVLTTSGVARYSIDSKGELVDGPWAVTWPDEIVRLPEGQPRPPHVTGLTIVRRESVRPK
jgi:DNA-binding beta-propeller fold protein YncE